MGLELGMSNYSSPSFRILDDYVKELAVREEKRTTLILIFINKITKSQITL